MIYIYIFHVLNIYIYHIIIQHYITLAGITTIFCFKEIAMSLDNVLSRPCHRYGEYHPTISNPFTWNRLLRKGDHALPDGLTLGSK